VYCNDIRNCSICCGICEKDLGRDLIQKCDIIYFMQIRLLYVEYSIFFSSPVHTKTAPMT
jgi:hypothetical protein